MEQTTDIFEYDLYDAAKELGAVVVIKYYTLTIRVPLDILELIHTQLGAASASSCIAYAFYSNKKSHESLLQFIDEAVKEGGELSISFTSEDGGPLAFKSPEEAPAFDAFIKVFQAYNKEHSYEGDSNA